MPLLSTLARRIVRFDWRKAPNDVAAILYETVVAWSGLSADTFVRDEQAKPEPGSLSIVSTYLKSDPRLTPEAADALDELTKATYERMRKKD